jgi:hypothetical protein
MIFEKKSSDTSFEPSETWVKHLAQGYQISTNLQPHDDTWVNCLAQGHWFKK